MALIRDIRKGFLFLRRNQSITAEDLALLDRYLNEAEKECFHRMDEPDQIHSVHVARLCARSLANCPQADERLVMTAALVHDVGKIGANLSLTFRTFWILGHKIAPRMLEWVALRSASARPGSLRQKMYVQITHPALGAEMLESTGTEDDVRLLVSETWQRGSPGDPIEKRILLAADGDRVVGEAGPPAA